jgi:hypothetical protein
MTTIYLGDSLVSYDGPRFSHLSKEAREVAYFEQFRPENLREIRAAPMVTVVGAALIGFLALGAPFSVDAECALSCGCGPAVSPPPSLGQRFHEERETHPLRTESNSL